MPHGRRRNGSRFEDGDRGRANDLLHQPTAQLALPEIPMPTKSLLRTVLTAATAMLILLHPARAQTQTLRIAFNAPDLASPPFAYTLALIQKEAEARGVTIFPQNGKGSAAQQAGDLMNSINMGLDGIILAPNDGDTLSPTVNDALAANMPIVTISCRLNGIDKPLRQLSGEEHPMGLTGQAEAALEALLSYVRDRKPLLAAEAR